MGVIWLFDLWFKDHSDFGVEIRKGQEQRGLLEMLVEGAGGMSQGNHASGQIWGVLEVELKEELSDWLWGLKKKKETWVIPGFGLTTRWLLVPSTKMRKLRYRMDLVKGGCLWVFVSVSHTRGIYRTGSVTSQGSVIAAENTVWAYRYQWAFKATRLHESIKVRQRRGIWGL